MKEALAKSMREAVLREDERARDEDHMYDHQKVLDEFSLCGLEHETIRELLEQVEFELQEEGRLSD